MWISCFADSALRLTYMYTHWQSQHACNHMPNARVGNCVFIRWPAHCRLLPSCLLASRACACSSLFGEAVSMSERSERILTMSEALVWRCLWVPKARTPQLRSSEDYQRIKREHTYSLNMRSLRSLVQRILTTTNNSAHTYAHVLLLITELCSFYTDTVLAASQLRGSCLRHSHQCYSTGDSRST